MTTIRRALCALLIMASCITVALPSYASEQYHIPVVAPKNTKVKIKSVVIKNKTMIYTGKPRKQDKGTVVSAVVKGKKIILKKGRDYTVTYKNNVRIGTAQMIIRGKGSYKGKLVRTFKILPPVRDFIKIRSKYDGFLASWNKGSGKLTGYILQYSTKKNFSGKKKTIRVKSSSVKGSVIVQTVTGLQPDKHYYVRLRSYKTVGKKTYYSAWNITRQIRTNVIPITRVKLNDSKITLKEGANKTLKARIFPKDTTDPKKITWTSSDRKVAAVSKNGVVTAKSAGTAKITATAGSRSATCQVTVRMPAMLTIIDDDGTVNFMEKLMPIVREKGISISTAVTPARIESGKSKYMTWDMIRECESQGAEVLCHTLNHVDSEVTEAMTEAEIEAEYRKAKQIFRRQGFNAAGKILVYSYGTGRLKKAQTAASRVFDCGINASGDVTNQIDADPFYLKRYAIQTHYKTSYSSMKKMLDRLDKNGGWMIWTLHANQKNLTDKRLDNLRKAIDYAKKKGIPIVTAEKGFREFKRRQ